jgi:hypothetical protein
MRAVSKIIQRLCLEEYLSYSSADRDFMEQYNTHDPDIVFPNPELSQLLKPYKKIYRQIEKYWVTHLRPEEPQINYTAC